MEGKLQHWKWHGWFCGSHGSPLIRYHPCLDLEAPIGQEGCSTGAEAPLSLDNSIQIIFIYVNNFGSFFPIIYIPLSSFSCFIVLNKTSSTILIGYGNSGQPCPDFSENAQNFSPFKQLMLIVWLLKIAFIMLTYVPCMFFLFRTFIVKGFQLFLKTLTASNEMIRQFFFPCVYWFPALSLDSLDRCLLLSVTVSSFCSRTFRLLLNY